MAGTLDLDFSAAAASKVLGKMLAQVEKEFWVAFLTTFRSHFIDDYMTAFEYQYDDEFVWGVKTRDEDPSSPQYIKSEVVAFIRGHLTSIVNDLQPSGGVLAIKAIPDSLWTLPGRKERDKVRLFYFYLNGTVGKYVGLSSNDYKNMYPNASKSSINIGRFGHFHMVPLHIYKDRYYDAQDNGQTGWPNPGKVYHPFSGAAPSLIFDRVFWSLDFGKYVEKTKKALSKS